MWSYRQDTRPREVVGEKRAQRKSSLDDFIYLATFICPYHIQKTLCAFAVKLISTNGHQCLAPQVLRIKPALPYQLNHILFLEIFICFHPQNVVNVLDINRPLVNGSMIVQHGNDGFQLLPRFNVCSENN